MKTKNTILNKIKFTSQYWGQRVFKETKYPNSPICNIDFTLFRDIDGYHLELKPLSFISDKDEKFIKKYLYEDPCFNCALVKDFLDNYEKLILYNKMPLICIDYLIENGYAIPYKDLSIEDLIHYGWIKLLK